MSTAWRMDQGQQQMEQDLTGERVWGLIRGVAVEMVRSHWLQVDMWVFIMFLMMTHPPVLGKV